MEILLFKKTTDEDLKTGTEVCYKNLDGVFCKIGIITDFYLKHGKINYLINTSFGAYTADELKLIKK